MSDGDEFISNYILESANVLRGMIALKVEIELSVQFCKRAISNGRKIMFCGNGGSAADAQHLAAELMGRFMVDREPLPALALTVDTSALTAIGNDYGFEEIFARQLRGIGAAGDVVVGMSTSGESQNVVRAFSVARQMGITTIGMTGASGGAVAALSDILLPVQDSRTSHIQEAHIVIGHLMCAMIERELCLSKQ